MDGVTGRYLRNAGFVSEDEQRALSQKTVAVVGLGGLGGHISEQLTRLGVGKLILIDGDVVEPSNLNRQLFATELTLGQPKVLAGIERLRAVNSETQLVPHQVFLTPENGAVLLCGADIVLDALDNVPSRLTLEAHCKTLGIPFVHGAIRGTLGQVCFVSPGDDTLCRIYGARRPEKAQDPAPAFMPAIVASLQVAEAIRYLLNRGDLPLNQLFCLDLSTQHFHSIQL